MDFVLDLGLLRYPLKKNISRWFHMDTRTIGVGMETGFIPNLEAFENANIYSLYIVLLYIPSY